MTEPDDDAAEVTGMAAVAAESPKQSVQRERELLGDQPDVGGLVDDDRAQ